MHVIDFKRQNRCTGISQQLTCFYNPFIFNDSDCLLHIILYPVRLRTLQRNGRTVLYIEVRKVRPVACWPRMRHGGRSQKLPGSASPPGVPSTGHGYQDRRVRPVCYQGARTKRVLSMERKGLRGTVSMVTHV